MRKHVSLLIFIALILFIAFAIFPTKIDYTDRAKVIQGFIFAAPYKDSINEYWSRHGTLPTEQDWQAIQEPIEADLSQSVVESIQVGKDGPGTIRIRYTSANDPDAPADLTGTYIILTPQIENNDLEWSCKSTMPAEYIPNKCR